MLPEFLLAPARLLAGWLIKRTKADRMDGKNRVLNAQVRALNPGKADAVYQYHLEKLTGVIGLAMLVLPAVVLVFILSIKPETVQNGRLERPDYGSAARNEQLEASAGKEKRTINVSVPARVYKSEEAAQYLAQAQQELEQIYLGQNISADEVRTDLNLPQSLAGGRVSAQYIMVPYGMIGQNGEITGTPEKEGTIVRISAQLACQEENLTTQWAVSVYPPILTGEKEMWADVEEKAREAAQRHPEEAYMELPDEAGGSGITWYRTRSDLRALILILLILPAALYIHRDQAVRDEAAKRRRSLELEYPDLLWQIAMLLSAGLTIRGAFLRIAAQNKKSSSKIRNYACEELAAACYEMSSGVAEDAAYERFGRRCELPGYIKLGSTLAQNVRKGSRGLAAMLEKEAADSMEQRRNTARKLGEEAGTKMLFPMILMLGVVMVILMVPAFMTM